MVLAIQNPAAARRLRRKSLMTTHPRETRCSSAITLRASFSAK
jgi:hypothetical protein